MARGVRFVDEAWISVTSGRGGDGCLAFRREKYVPRGGPDGGDGGRGGHVILHAQSQVSTLLDIGRSRAYRAPAGQPGRGKNQTGRNGEDLVIDLPVGTLVRDRGTGTLLVDLDHPGMTFRIAVGGQGGRGNKSFATATHQTPREWEPGEDGQTFELDLELKLVADVGLLGLPNAGKSTFLSRVSAAHPRIADYPFTTLAPQLGIVELDSERRLVVADIPGIIEGAHEGVGLGLEFLRHLERTRALLHLLDPFDRTLEQLIEDHRVIRGELDQYGTIFAGRPKLTAVNKGDLMPPEEHAALVRGLEDVVGEPVVGISAVTGVGVPVLLDRLWRIVVEARSAAEALEPDPEAESGPEPTPGNAP